jgi:hypothetical protein
LKEGAVTLSANQWAATDTPLAPGTNWIDLANVWPDKAVALRSDGTLWKWTFPKDRTISRTAVTGRKFSRHADWIAVSQSWIGGLALSADGTLWSLEEISAGPFMRASRKPRLIATLP